MGTVTNATTDLQRENVQKRSRIYQLTGYRKAKPVKRSDSWERFLSFCVDFCVMLSPLYLWIIVILLYLTGIIPPFNLVPLNFIVLIVLAVSSIMFNGITSVYLKGQTLGKYWFGFKLVKLNNKEATSSTYFLREALGFGVPFLVLGFFTNVLGILAFLLVDGLLVIFHPRHCSLIDLILGTKVVRLMFDEVITEPQEAKKEIYMPSIDLHIHSNFSLEGKQNVEEIFKNAKRLEMKYISITDQNTVKANTLAKRISKLYNVGYITGVYLDASYKGKHVGVLGYGIDPQNDIFVYLENEFISQVKRTNEKRLELFSEVSGANIDIQAVRQNQRFDGVSSKHLARYILNTPGLRDNAILKRYRGVNDHLYYEEFHKDFFEKGGYCYIEMKYPPIEDILETIHLADGKAFISDIEDFDEETLVELIHMGFDGVECFRPAYNQEEQYERLKNAREYKKFISEGSGFYAFDEGSQLAETSCPKEAEYLVERYINESKKH